MWRVSARYRALSDGVRGNDRLAGKWLLHILIVTPAIFVWLRSREFVGAKFGESSA